MKVLAEWRADDALAGIRDAAPLAKLPTDEQKDWRALRAPVPALITVVSTSFEGEQPWRYTTKQPAEGWKEADFDDRVWQEGSSGFGGSGKWAIQSFGVRQIVRTKWNTDDIWLRREFTMPEPTPEIVELRVTILGDALVFINGVLALRHSGGPGLDYEDMPISSEAWKALRPGRNVLAVYCRQPGGREGERFIDVGMTAVKIQAGALAAQVAEGERFIDVGMTAVKIQAGALAAQVAARQYREKPLIPTEREVEGEISLSLTSAAEQAWFGQQEEYLATCDRVLEVAKDAKNPVNAERAAKMCSLRPSDRKTHEAALVLARRAVELGKGNESMLFYFQMALGMAEYRCGHYAAADTALLRRGPARSEELLRVRHDGVLSGNELVQAGQRSRGSQTGIRGRCQNEAASRRREESADRRRQCRRSHSLDGLQGGQCLVWVDTVATATSRDSAWVTTSATPWPPRDISTTHSPRSARPNGLSRRRVNLENGSFATVLRAPRPGPPPGRARMGRRPMTP